MKIAFLDTNVVIDFLSGRRPFAQQAARIFSAGLSGKVQLYVAAVSYNNIYYVLRKSLSHSKTIASLIQLSELTLIVDVSKSIITKSLESKFKDFEDAIQYNCAMSIKNIDFIISRNIKDFQRSSIPVVTPGEAIPIINNTPDK